MDLIERQVAIKVMTSVLWHLPNEWYRNLNEYEFSKGLAELGLNSVPSAQQDYRTDHGYMWLCPECGLSVHSDFVKCVRCGFMRHDTQQDYEWKEG